MPNGTLKGVGSSFIQTSTAPITGHKRPGAELVINDILSAVDYAKRHANIDSSRIYLVGCSGGGHAALVMAGRAHSIWASLSARVPVTDLAGWYFQCKQADTKYAEDIVKSCTAYLRRIR